MTWNILCERMFLEDNLKKFKENDVSLSNETKDKITVELKNLNDVRYKKILSIIQELNIDILLLQEADKVFLDKAKEMGFDSEQLEETNKIFNYKKRINGELQSDAAFIYYNKEKLNSLNEKSFSFNSGNGSTINIAIFNITSEQKRIQYQTDDMTSSSLTIDSRVFDALDNKMEDAKSWCKNKAREVRTELEREARDLESKGELVKLVGKQIKPITIEEYVRGKVSNGVRQLALDEIIDPRYK